MLLNCGIGEDTWESLGLQGDPSSHFKGNQSWIFIERTDPKAESSVLWPSDANIWLIWKDPDARKDWRWKEKRTIEDEMVGQHHWLSGHEFDYTWKLVMDREAQCAAFHEVTEFDTTEQLNWTERILQLNLWKRPWIPV